MIFKLVYNK